MKYPNRHLQKHQQDEILLEFCHALSSIKKPEEAASFLTDLLGSKEMEMLAMRLQVAKCLHQNLTYHAIKKRLKVSYSTIARISAWIANSGEGFRLVLGRIKTLKPAPILPDTNWNSLKHRYPSYFWPQLLLEEIVRDSSRRQKAKIKRTLSILRLAKKKPALYRQLAKLTKIN